MSGHTPRVKLTATCDGLRLLVTGCERRHVEFREAPNLGLPDISVKVGVPKGWTQYRVDGCFFHLCEDCSANDYARGHVEANAALYMRLIRAEADK